MNMIAWVSVVIADCRGVHSSFLGQSLYTNATMLEHLWHRCNFSSDMRLSQKHNYDISVSRYTKDECIAVGTNPSSSGSKSHGTQTQQCLGTCDTVVTFRVAWNSHKSIIRTYPSQDTRKMNALPLGQTPRAVVAKATAPSRRNPALIQYHASGSCHWFLHSASHPKLSRWRNIFLIHPNLTVIPCFYVLL